MEGPGTFVRCCGDEDGLLLLGSFVPCLCPNFTFERDGVRGIGGGKIVVVEKKELLGGWAWAPGF